MSYYDDKMFEELEEKYHRILNMLREVREDFEIIGAFGLYDSVDAGDCRHNVRRIDKLLKELGEKNE